MSGLGLNNMAMQNYNVGKEAAAGLCPSDLQTQIQRLQYANVDLAHIADQCLALVGRIYGEGQTDEKSNPVPRPAGLSAEMSEAISGTENVTKRIGIAVARLSQFA